MNTLPKSEAGKALTGYQTLRWLCRRLEDKPPKVFSLVSPYLGGSAVQRLLASAGPETTLQILTDASSCNLVSGATDVVALRVGLAHDRCCILHTPRLHAKVYLFDSDLAVVGSANATAPGLWTEAAGNRELSVIVEPAGEVHEYVQWLKDRSTTLKEIPDQSPTEAHRLAGGSEIPRLVFSQFPTFSPIRMNLGTTLGGSAFETRLHAELRWSGAETLDELWREWPPVMTLLHRLGHHGPQTFGALAAFFHERTDAIPPPERKSIKEATRLLLDWTLVLLPGSITSSVLSHSTVYKTEAMSGRL